MKLQIVDLDGCISDDRWRRHLILPAPVQNNSHFEEYHRLGHADNSVNLHEIVPEVPIVIITTRPLTYYTATLRWVVAAIQSQPHAIIMRNPNDHRPSLEIKREQVQWLWDPNMVYGADGPHEIISAIDDQEKIVAMYRENGIPARVVRIGEEHVYG